MFIRIRQPVISSFFPSAIMQILCHFSIPIPDSPYFTVIGAISVASVRQSEAQLRPKWPQTRRLILQLLLFLPPLLLLRQVVLWLLRRSWCSFSAWMLALTLSVMSCVRWTPVSIVLNDDRLASMVSPLLPLLLWRLRQMRMAMIVLMMMMRMRMLALLLIMRWRSLSDLPFVIRDKNGK